MKKMKVRRTEYPRPQFVRSQWVNLNGEWEFAFDEENIGLDEGWFRGETPMNLAIQVPFVFQSMLSGIGESRDCDTVWYRKKLTLEEGAENRRVILHFGAVDYEAQVFINGSKAGSHTGGNTPFAIDITPYLVPGEQMIVVRAWDPIHDEQIPRGKQFWKPQSESIWYTPSTGIWQTVWIEYVNPVHLTDIRFTSDVMRGTETMEAQISRVAEDTFLEYRVTYKEEIVAEGRTRILRENTKLTFDVLGDRIFNTNFHNDGRCWTPEHPNLFDVTVCVTNAEGGTLDRVDTYFGFREISVKDGMTLLNGKPYYQKLVLDQGYWRLGLLTAPNDEDFRTDICLAKEMGFNGCRKHQKMEDPRFLYWADRLGYLVWGECSAAPIFTEKAQERLISEWKEVIRRDYSHPCIVAWTPLNESWGVPEICRDQRQQAFANTLYELLHALDGTRLVSGNDGWEQTKTDICAIHNYRHGQKKEVEIYAAYKKDLSDVSHLIASRAAGRPVFAEGYSYSGQPILLTEYGGIGFDVNAVTGWGYTTVRTKEEFVEDYGRIMAAVYASTGLWGYCYTQLCDVEQEINGLLTYDRAPKCDLAKIRAINDGWHPDHVEN